MSAEKVVTKPGRIVGCVLQSKTCPSLQIQMNSKSYIFRNLFHLQQWWLPPKSCQAVTLLPNAHWRTTKRKISIKNLLLLYTFWSYHPKKLKKYTKHCPTFYFLAHCTVKSGKTGVLGMFSLVVWWVWWETLTNLNSGCSIASSCSIAEKTRTISVMMTGQRKVMCTALILAISWSGVGM